MNLKISRGEQARVLLVRYAWTLKELSEVEAAAKKYDEENPFEGGGAYADAGWSNNPARRELWDTVSMRRKMIENFEREIRATAEFLLEDQLQAKPEASGNVIKYQWEIDEQIVNQALTVLEGADKGAAKAVSLKFENPHVIEALTRKLFNQDRTASGRVFAYGVVRPEFKEAGASELQRENILALLPISPTAYQDAIMYALSTNIVSLLLTSYLEARREIDRRDQLNFHLKTP